MFIFVRLNLGCSRLYIMYIFSTQIQNLKLHCHYYFNRRLEQSNKIRYAAITYLEIKYFFKVSFLFNSEESRPDKKQYFIEY